MELREGREDRREAPGAPKEACGCSSSMQLLSSNGLSDLIHFKVPSLQSLRMDSNDFALSKRGLFRMILEPWVSA